MVQSVARAIDILEILAEEGSGMRLSEVAEVAGLKNNTAHNLLKTLIKRGYVEKGHGPSYGLGQAAIKLAYAGGINSIVGSAVPPIRSLQKSFPCCTVVLSQRIGGNIVVRLRMSPDRPGVLQKPHGMTFHPYGTASGLAFLTFSSTENSLKIRQQAPFYEQGVNVWGTPDKLDDFLEESREKGYVVTPFKGEEGFRAAVPVFDQWGTANFVLGASFTRGEMKSVQKESLLSEIREKARDISKLPD